MERVELPIRVLHRGMSYNRGGIEACLMNYYRHMDRNLVQFDFIVPKGMTIAFEDEIKSMGGNVYKEIVGIKHHLWKGLTYDRFFFKKHPEIAILHVNDCSAANLRLMKTAKKCGVCTRILHSHNNDYLVPLKKRQLVVEKNNKKNLRKIATDLFACSEDAGKFMFGELPFVVVRNAIETEKYLFCNEKREKCRTELGLAENQTAVGCVARLDHQKNHMFLLEVFAEYKKIDLTSSLILVGDGILKEKIEERAEELGITSSVIILGMRDDIPNLLNAFDVFLLPSKSEGLGMVLIEAQINGLHCLASDRVPAEANILNLVEYVPLERNPVYWAEKMKQVLALGQANRKIDIKTVQEAGYDITIESHKLQEFYLNKVRSD